jgi:hypothetical protein
VKGCRADPDRGQIDLQEPEGLGVDDVEAAASVHEDRQCHPRTDLRLFGFNIWFSPLEWGREQEPSGGSVRLGPWLLLQRSLASRPEFVVPQALRCGGCSYPREWNRSSVYNGTLSAGVCSLWLSGPEHLRYFGCNTMFLPLFEH